MVLGANIGSCELQKLATSIDTFKCGCHLIQNIKKKNMLFALRLNIGFINLYHTFNFN